MLLLNTAQAQEEKKSSANSRIRNIFLVGGINQSNMKAEYLESPTPLYGAHFGILAKESFSSDSKFYISTGLFYSKQGYKQNLGTTEVEVALHYTNLQALAGYKLVPSLALDGGIQVGLLLQNRSK